jgi:hypothetical protein
MQLSDIRTNVRYAAGVDTTDAMATDATLNYLINAAIREVNNLRDWDWAKASEVITTVVDQKAYARAATCKKTTRLEDVVDGNGMRSITPAGASRYNDNAGQSAFYFVEAGKINLLPIPDSIRTYNHYFISTETALSADGDEPLVPDHAIDLVIIKAAIQVAARTDNTSQYRLLVPQERSREAALQDEARSSKASPQINSRRDWNRQRGSFL